MARRLDATCEFCVGKGRVIVSTKRPEWRFGSSSSFSLGTDHLVVLLYQALCYVNLQVHVQGIRKSLCSIPVGLVMWAARRSDDVCRTIV